MKENALDAPNAQPIQAIRDKFWAFVAVFGTLWGGLELTLGTFLHVLHVPKTGFIMVMLTSILLIAQRRIFPARWSTLAAGAVAACIKCLSPGGIILGPVFGILSEALVIELFLMVRPRSVISGMTAASMALLWSQFQSVFKTWIYYGKDFIDSLIKMIEKFLKIEWTAAIGITAVIIAASIILASGAAAGWIGNRLGRRVLNELESAETQKDVLHECTFEAETPQGQAESIIETSAQPEAISVQDQPHREPKPHAAEVKPQAVSELHGKKGIAPNARAVATRRFVWPFAIAAIGLQFTDTLWISAVGAVLWFTVLFIAARGVLRAMWWPKFWAVSAIISLACGLILAWNPGESWQWSIGAEASLRMLLRGGFVFAIVNWATRCIRPEEILRVWNKVHLPGLGHAIACAYSLLPAWLDRMNTMLHSRPSGLFANCRYIRECCYTCLVEAAQQTQTMTQSGAPRMQ